MASLERTRPEGRAQVDYDRLSTGYDRHRRGGGPYLARLVALAAETGARHVLELGTGTGNNAQALLEAYPCTATGLDVSAGMLRRARTKGIGSRWIQATATAIPLAAACVDFVFAVYLLHHLADLDALCKEVARVLKRGYAAFVTAPRDFIERHPMNRYFPSFAEIDRTRFQSVEDVADALVHAGFTRIATSTFVAEPRPIDAAYVDRVADKFISTYELIPPDEFEQGLRRLRADVAQCGRLDVDMVWESVMIAGYKP